MRTIHTLIAIGLAAPVLNAQWTREEQLPATDITSLHTAEALVYAGTDSHCYVSHDGGGTFVPGAPVPGSPTFIDALYTHQDLLIAGTNGNGIFISDDHGFSWSPFSQGLTGLGSGTISSFTVFNDDLYCSTMGAGVFQRGGNSWWPFGGLGGNVSANVPFVKAIDGVLWAGAGGNGMIWQLLPGQNEFMPIEVAPISTAPLIVTDIVRVGDELLLGSTYGAYRSSDDGYSWSPCSMGMVANGEVRFLQADGVLFALVNRVDSKLYRSTNEGNSWELIDVMPVTYAIGLMGTRLYAARTDGLWYRDDLVTKVEATVAPAVLSVFPNPATDRVVVRSAFPERLAYSLRDMQGRVVRNGQLWPPMDELSVAGLAKGSYVLVLDDHPAHLRECIVVQ